MRERRDVALSHTCTLAHRLLDGRDMIKTVLSTSILATLLCGPALAGPDATYQVDLSVRADGKPVRNYTVRLTDHFCGYLKARVDDALDEIKVCTDQPQGTKVPLRVEWTLVAKNRDLAQSSSVIAERGVKFTLDSGTAKLDVSLQ